MVDYGKKGALLSKVGLLWGEWLIMGKRGSFLKYLINFSWSNSLYVSTSVFDLEIGNWGWFAKTNEVVAKNDPNMPKFESKQIWVFICIDVALLLVAFYCVGINHQKGEIEREMCPWAISKYFGD
jgi:hypothetical protein